MNKKVRDYIFYFYIFFFIIGTVLVSLYASGYKFNLSWPLKFNRVLIKTGIIAANTVPSGAVIYINNEPQANFSLNPWNKEYLKTAAKVKNVLPGEYDLRFELAGYWPFQKKITVYSGQTTFAEDINLFRDDQPLLIEASGETKVKLSSTKKYLYIPATGKVISLKTGEARTLPEGNVAAIWLSNEDKLLSAGKVFGINPTDDTDYISLIGAEAKDWNLEESTGRLYYRNNSSLNYLRLSNKTSVTAVSGESYDAYEPRGDNLFFTASGAGKVTLKKYSLSSQKIEQELNLPSVGKYEFRSENAKSLVLYDSLNKTLYILNPDNITSGAQTIKNVISWQWVDDNTILFNNSWEIYRFNLKTGVSDLLTRVGEEITGLIWNSDGNYLIFSTANSLSVLDMKMNAITKIYSTDKISGPILDVKDNILYFWAKKGEESGVYKMILQ